MKLINIYELSENSSKIAVFLYEMLRTRDPSINISHREMPSFGQHSRFIGSMPYAAWYVIEHDGSWIGNCYLTKKNEIGIFLTAGARGQGIGKEVIQALISIHGKHRYLANIAPRNPISRRFFRKLGFKLIQYTYELDHGS